MNRFVICYLLAAVAGGLIVGAIGLSAGFATFLGLMCIVCAVIKE